MRYWVWLAMVAMMAQLAVGSVRGRSLLGSIDWSRVRCTFSKRGTLQVLWGPESHLKVTIPRFQSLSGNGYLTYIITDSQTGDVSFQERTWWGVDPWRHSESRCVVVFSEMAGRPLRFRVSVACKNLLPVDKGDGGITDVSAELSDEKIVCSP